MPSIWEKYFHEDHSQNIMSKNIFTLVVDKITRIPHGEWVEMPSPVAAEVGLPDTARSRRTA